jgi:fermentation-respiration switch protein FrsA (DUF1100 family)
MMNPYTYSMPEEKPGIALLKSNSRYLQYTVRIPSAMDIGYDGAGLSAGEFFLPGTGRKFPLAILVHGMGDYSVFPCLWLAGSLLKRGVASFIPYLVIHSTRLPESTKERMPYLTPEEWFRIYQVSVVEIRQVVDWAYTRDELDSQRIATIGISFGGFISSIAMGIDNRIKAGVFIVSGGNHNKISWLSKDDGYRDRYPRSEIEHNDIQRCYEDYLEKVSRLGFDNVTASDNSFLTDPMTFAEGLRGRPIFMINARNDKYIPPEAVNDFWKAAGKPPIRWVSSGHSSLWLHYPSIRRDITIFLQGSGIF